MLSPFLGSLGKVASSGADLLKNFGDFPLGETVGKTAEAAKQPISPPGNNLAQFKTAAQFGGSLRDLMGGGGGGMTAPSIPAMSLPQPPNPVVAQPAQPAPGSSFTPSAKTLADVMFRR
jgi:hypothetical protein